MKYLQNYDISSEKNIELICKNNSQLDIKNNDDKNQRILITLEKDSVENDLKIMEIFQNYEFLKYETKYNKNYDYKIYSDTYLNTELFGIWNNLQYVFEDSIIRPKFNLKLSGLGNICGHSIIYGKIFYKISQKKSQEILDFTIENCFSLKLLDKIRSYLFIDYEDLTSNIAYSTKKFEMHKFKTIFSSRIRSDITIEELCNFSATCRSKKSQIISEEVQELKSIESIKSLFLTYDNKIGVETIIDNKKYYFDLENFQEYINENLYNEFLDKKNEYCYKMKVENKTMNMKLLDNYIGNYEKYKKRKIRNQERYDEISNVDNCWLYSLFNITNEFSIRKHMNLFKQKTVMIQFEIANGILKPLNKRIVFIRKVEMVVEDFINTIEEERLILFYSYTTPLHSESIKNRKVLGEVSESIKQMMKNSMNIIEFKIEKLE